MKENIQTYVAYYAESKGAYRYLSGLELLSTVRVLRLLWAVVCSHPVTSLMVPRHHHRLLTASTVFLCSFHGGLFKLLMYSRTHSASTPSPYAFGMSGSREQRNGTQRICHLVAWI